ncbi:MAG: HNH endonuclease [Woeseia sp.]|nr:HNH endonuclease [Woeseia sp.]
MSIENKRHLTHRLMYEIAYGEIPQGAFICHHCDNPPCCNPAHLYAGNAKTNQRDARERNRRDAQADIVNVKRALEIRWQDPEQRARAREGIRKIAKKNWKDPEYRAEQSRLAKKRFTAMWQDPEHRKAHCAKLSEAQREKVKDPEYIAKLSAGVSRGRRARTDRLRIEAGAPEGYKKCSTCQAWKDPKDFNTERRTWDGLSSRCRVCNRARDKLRQRNRSKSNVKQSI